MKSGKKFKRAGAPTLLEQQIGPMPEFLRNVPCSVMQALDSSIGKNSIAGREWALDTKAAAVGKGLTTGRESGGSAVKTKSIDLQNYIRRNHEELLVEGNYSEIARKILHRESLKPNGGWSDKDWLNGEDGALSRIDPKESNLRRVVAKLIPGKG